MRHSSAVAVWTLFFSALFQLNIAADQQLGNMEPVYIFTHSSTGEMRQIQVRYPDPVSRSNRYAHKKYYRDHIPQSNQKSVMATPHRCQKAENIFRCLPHIIHSCLPVVSVNSESTIEQRRDRRKKSPKARMQNAEYRVFFFHTQL